MALGVWHFAAKSHIDVKHIYSRFGNIVSDNTVWKALDSIPLSLVPIGFQPFVLQSGFRGSMRRRRHSVLTVRKPRKLSARNIKKRGEIYDVIG